LSTKALEAIFPFVPQVIPDLDLEDAGVVEQEVAHAVDNLHLVRLDIDLDDEELVDEVKQAVEATSANARSAGNGAEGPVKSNAPPSRKIEPGAPPAVVSGKS